ncbi:hypothetical protein BJY04DRAFT_214470 [Aspergillus karnatakaensis]|uniref:uncharacterized protein n=1 Tax=Aspergillus karnatakaensis TaxID=1810916 RepID=UPI003CCD3E7D
MKVAIAGTGPVAHYLHTTLPTLTLPSTTTNKNPITTIALTRTQNQSLNPSIEQRITTYTIPSLTPHLSDIDALISTISAPSPLHETANLNLLAACRESPKCKRFIPSEFTGNLESHPSLEPKYMHKTRQPIRDALRNQSEVQWTILLVGWFTEYLLPVTAEERLFEEFAGWAVDFTKREFTVYGDGESGVSLTSVRDFAGAVGALLLRDLGNKEGGEGWEEFIHLEGERVSWNGILEMLQERDGGVWGVKRKELEEAVAEVEEAEKGGGYSEIVASQLQLLGYTDFNVVDGEKARAQRERYFPGSRFRGVREVLDHTASQPGEGKESIV